MNTARTDWVDYAKSIGIILVVYGHLLSSGYHAGLSIPKHFFELSDSIIYTFHMPLFFLLAGLFAEGSLQKRGARKYLIDKLLRIAYPYFLWSILQIGVEILFSSQTQRKAVISDIPAIVYKTWGQFWFLYALLIMFVVFTLIKQTGKFSMPMLYLVGLVLFFKPLQISEAALLGFSTHFLFFVLGVGLRHWLMERDGLSLPPWTIPLLFSILLGSGYFVFDNLLEPGRILSVRHPFYVLYFSALGIITCISLAKYISQKNILPFLKTFGSYSLQIYLVHMLAGVGARLVLLRMFHLQNWVLHILIEVTAALFIPTMIQKWCERIDFPYLFELKIKR